MLVAFDTMLIDEGMTRLHAKLVLWRKILVVEDLEINLTKTQYVGCSFCKKEMKMTSQAWFTGDTIE